LTKEQILRTNVKKDESFALIENLMKMKYLMFLTFHILFLCNLKAKNNLKYLTTDLRTVLNSLYTCIWEGMPGRQEPHRLAMQPRASVRQYKFHTKTKKNLLEKEDIS